MVFQQKIKNIGLLVFALVLLLGQSGYAQGENRPVKKIDWNSVTKGEQFREKGDAEKPPPEENKNKFLDQEGDGDFGDGSGNERSDSNWELPRGSRSDSMFKATWFKSLAIFLIIAVALIILILFIKKKPKNLSIKTNLEDAILTAEEDIDKSDLRYLLKMALEQNNLKAALRIYYLIIIKELNQNNLIHYKKDKTNYAYILEMTGKPEFKDFKNLTMAYEYHWYGDKELNLERFNHITPAIEKFLSLVKSKYGSND